MPKHKIAPIKNLFEALDVRVIRNECKSFMTNNVNSIGIINQIFWYFGTYIDQSRKKVFMCYLLKVDGQSCGYGVIRKEAGKYWLTGGIKKSFRGQGLGRVLFNFLIRHISAPTVWLEVRNSNKRAISLYKSLGFLVDLESKSKKGISIMRLSK